MLLHINGKFTMGKLKSSLLSYSTLTVTSLLTGSIRENCHTPGCLWIWIACGFFVFGLHAIYYKCIWIACHLILCIWIACDLILCIWIACDLILCIWIARRFCVFGLLVVPADFEDENKGDNAMFIYRKIY
jgi:hypothetical protein